jgi:hypothetical protein
MAWKSMGTGFLDLDFESASTKAFYWGTQRFVGEE